MYRALPLLLALAVVALARPAASQGEPGWGLAWEEVGDRPIDADAFTLDARGTLWAAAADTVRWLDLTAGAPGRWRGVTYFWPGPHPDAMLALGADTLIGAGGRTNVTTDGGATWPQVWDRGDYALYEIPAGHPAARRVLAGTGGGTTGAGYSDDRGTTWAFATVTAPGPPDHRLYTLAAVPPGTAPGAPARVVAGGVAGLYLSDDGGASWHAGPVYDIAMNGRFVAALERPATEGGGVRIVALLNTSGAGYVLTYTSEDGGDTWALGPDLVEPQGDGLGWPAVEGLVSLGGSSALVLLGRGRIHRTDDGGQTWAAIAQAPRPNTFTIASTAALGADGRLYVAMTEIGGNRAWVYRSAEVLTPTVGTAPPPPTESGLRLDAVPNPASGAVTLSLALPAPGPVRLAVYDGLGREVAVLADGALAAGPHAFAFDAAALPAGVYLARATAGAATVTARLTLAR